MKLKQLLGYARFNELSRSVKDHPGFRRSMVAESPPALDSEEHLPDYPDRWQVSLFLAGVVVCRIKEVAFVELSTVVEEWRNFPALLAKGGA